MVVKPSPPRGERRHAPVSAGRVGDGHDGGGVQVAVRGQVAPVEGEAGFHHVRVRRRVNSTPRTPGSMCARAGSDGGGGGERAHPARGRVASNTPWSRCRRDGVTCGGGAGWRRGARPGLRRRRRQEPRGGPPGQLDHQAAAESPALPAVLDDDGDGGVVVGQAVIAGHAKAILKPSSATRASRLAAVQRARGSRASARARPAAAWEKKRW